MRRPSANVTGSSMGCTPSLEPPSLQRACSAGMGSSGQGQKFKQEHLIKQSHVRAFRKAEDSVWWRGIPPTWSTRMVFPSRESASLIPFQGHTGGNIFSQITSVFGESQKHSTVHVWRWVSQETQDFYLRWVTLVIIILSLYLSMLWFYYVFNLSFMMWICIHFKVPWDKCIIVIMV